VGSLAEILEELRNRLQQVEQFLAWPSSHNWQTNLLLQIRRRNGQSPLRTRRSDEIYPWHGIAKRHSHRTKNQRCTVDG